MDEQNVSDPMISGTAITNQLLADQEMAGPSPSSPKKRKRDILQDLIIGDNKIYDQIHQEAFNLDPNDGNTRRRRAVEPTNYNVRSLLNDLISNNHAKETDLKLGHSKRSSSPKVKIIRNEENSLTVQIHYRTQRNVKNRLRIKRSDDTNGNGNNRQLINGDYQALEDDLEIPYRGIFSFEEANTFYTRPTNQTRLEFNNYLKNSEALLDSNSNLSLVKKLTKQEELIEKDLENQILVSSKLRCIHIKGFEIDTWYRSPYPKEYISKYVLHLCEYCLKYFNSSFTLKRHECKCQYRKQPPGNEIYRDSKVALFEVDGRKNIVYCQNLCLFAKLYLNSKTLYYDVEPFMFYILYELDYSSPASFYNFVGYFSKEKLNGTNYNLSCILTLPIYQRKGYGNLLIDFSYILTKKEYKLGTPEKPLSDLGLLSYRNYWKITIAKALRELFIKEKRNLKFFSIDDLANYTGMIHNDVVVGLEQLHFLCKDLKTNKYGIKINFTTMNNVLRKWDEKKYHKLDSDLLVWKPAVLGPSGGINTSSTMVITANDIEQKENNETGAADESSPKYDEKGNKLMSNISLILNFLRDDIDDDRDIQDQIVEKIQNYATDERLSKEAAFDFDQSIECIPENANKISDALRKFEKHLTISDLKDANKNNYDVFEDEDEEEEEEEEEEDEDEEEYEEADGNEDDEDEDEDEEGYLEENNAVRMEPKEEQTSNNNVHSQSEMAPDTVRRSLRRKVVPEVQVSPLRKSTRTASILRNYNEDDNEDD